MNPIAKFLFEMRHLKEIKHEGWRVIGVQFPDSVAEHSLCAAQIAYVLAKMEGADALRVTSMLVWHDMAETRIGDLHKIATHYIKGKDSIEDLAMEDQLRSIGFGKEIMELVREYELHETLDGRVAKDADYLEQAFQARAYQQTGIGWAAIFLEIIGKALRTESAKILWNDLQTMDFWEWSKSYNFHKPEAAK